MKFLSINFKLLTAAFYLIVEHATRLLDVVGVMEWVVLMLIQLHA